jgi:hypothetical protein
MKQKSKVSLAHLSLLKLFFFYIKLGVSDAIKFLKYGETSEIPS